MPSWKKPWIDSCVAGNVTTDTETFAVDDFYLYVNKDRIASNEIPEGSPTLEFDLTVEPRARMQKALAGDALSGHDAHQAQLLYRTIVDTDAREAAGCEPAKQVIDDIRSISTIEGMNAFLLDLDRGAGVPTLIRVRNSADYEEGCWGTRIELSDPTFGATIETMGISAATVDPDSIVYQARNALVQSVLTRAGFYG